ncbi:hypothetical protein [Pseudomonas chlororaphis]|uniref:hypothetical protein n=1 Tax=Pseudomonas chlororaphis TaxID=587753 RepID=UPI001F1565DB|nr:hypothetical protein [Pseudomonas chlororaphis]
MAGLPGDMLRASGSDLGLRQILQRMALRFLASGLLGMATLPARDGALEQPVSGSRIGHRYRCDWRRCRRRPEADRAAGMPVIHS